MSAKQRWVIIIIITSISSQELGGYYPSINAPPYSLLLTPGLLLSS